MGSEQLNIPLTVLSLGGGQDSTYILYRLALDPSYRKRFAPGDLIAVMADTGNEHPHTYAHVNFCARFCEDFGIPFFFLGDEWRSNSWKGGLQGHYDRYQVIMSKAMRKKSCTDQLKISPIYRFLSDYVNRVYLNGMFRPKGKQSLKVYARRFGKIRVLIGISAEEASRRIEKGNSGPAYFRICIDKVYPLVEDRLSRSDCQREIKKMNLPVPFPSNCMWCPFMSKIELLWLYKHMPGQVAELLLREEAKRKKFAHKEKNYGVFGKKSLDVVLDEAIQEYGHLTDQELEEHKFSHGHCVLSAY